MDAHPVLADAVPPDEQEEPVMAGDAAIVLRAQNAARTVLQQAGAHCRDKRRRGAVARLWHACTAWPRRWGGSQCHGGPSPTHGGDSTVLPLCKCFPTSLRSPVSPLSLGWQRGDVQSHCSRLHSAQALPPPSPRDARPGICSVPGSARGCQPEPRPSISCAHSIRTGAKQQLGQRVEICSDLN